MEMWRYKRIQRVTHASIEGTPMEDRSMQGELIEEKVGVRQSKVVTLVEMLGSIKRLEQEGSVGRIGCNKAKEVKVKQGRVDPPIVKRASVRCRAKGRGFGRVV